MNGTVLPVILSEAKDLPWLATEQILRRCARAVAIAALARRRPQNDKAGPNDKAR